MSKGFTATIGGIFLGFALLFAWWFGDWTMTAVFAAVGATFFALGASGGRQRSCGDATDEK